MTSDPPRDREICILTGAILKPHMVANTLDGPIAIEAWGDRPIEYKDGFAIRPTDLGKDLTKCPRCDAYYLHPIRAFNSTSHQDDETAICVHCGEEEAFLDSSPGSLSAVNLSRAVQRTADMAQRTLGTKVAIYASGQCCLSACAETSLEAADVGHIVNYLRPSGISTRWEISKETFKSGIPNPGPCEHDPGRRHWLLVC